MTESAPFSRIVRVDAIPQGGQTLAIEASPSEREALALLYQIPAIAALTATLRLERAGQGGARVVGAVHGELTQICVVSLEEFAATVDEDIDLKFAPRPDEDSGRRPLRETETLSIAGEDEPDPVIEGKIDVGALAAEFFALGLDPYPRKPGAEFVAPAESAQAASPFAALAAKPAKP
jgi:Large ribosomal RNA subunit accumulation protein YceD